VTTSATASDNTIPMLALIGIGLMYGPMSPDTNAIGSSAAITVKVARMVGPPTSSTAGGIASRNVLPPIAMCRWTFSTTTIASSTRIPIEKIRAKSETRLIVKPQAQDANRVTVSVRTTAAPTTSASRHPSASRTSTTTAVVANTSLPINVRALSSAVLP
jgi:hypothetical protein